MNFKKMSKKKRTILLTVILLIILFAAFSQILTNVLDSSPTISTKTFISLFLLVFASSFAIPTASFFLIASLTAITSSTSQVMVVFTVALLAGICGDVTAHLFAKSFQKEINKAISKNQFLKNEEEKAAQKFNRYGIKALFFSRFIVHGFSALLNYYSGLKKFPLKKFITPIIFGEIIYVSIYVSIGAFFKETWQVLLRIIQDSLTIILVILVIYYFYPKIRNKMKNK